MIKKIVGWCLIAFGLIGIGSEVDDYRQGKSKDPGIAVVMILLCLGGGTALLRSSRQDPLEVRALTPRPVDQTPLETAIIRLAKRSNGRITAAEVAAELGVAFDEARSSLERLSKHEACQTDVSETGVVVFRFPEFEDAHAKDNLL